MEGRATASERYYSRALEEELEEDVKRYKFIR